MAPLFGRRETRAPQATATEAFGRQRSEHVDAVGQLQAEITRVQVQADAADDRLKTLEISLQAVNERLQALQVHAIEHLMRGPFAIQAVTERSERAEAELDVEINRLAGTLGQLDELQFRFGADIGSLTQRYRETSAVLRQTIPEEKE